MKLCCFLELDTAWYLSRQKKIKQNRDAARLFLKPLFNFYREKVTTVFNPFNHFTVKKRWFYVKKIGYGFGSEKVFVSEQVKKDPDITDHNHFRTYILLLAVLLAVFSRLRIWSVPAVVSLHAEADVPLSPGLVEHQRQLGQEQVVF
jgi:hypothetical protein